MYVEFSAGRFTTEVDSAVNVIRTSHLHLYRIQAKPCDISLPHIISHLNGQIDKSYSTRMTTLEVSAYMDIFRHYLTLHPSIFSKFRPLKTTYFRKRGLLG